MSIRTWVVLTILLFAGEMVAAQNIDSLKKEFHKATSASVQLQTSYAIADASFYEREYDTSVSYLRRSVQASLHVDNDSMRMEACEFLADALFETRGYSEAVLYNDTAIGYARRLNMTGRLPDFLIAKGRENMRLGKWSEVVHALREALGLVLEAHNREEEAKLYKIWAEYYDYIGNPAMEWNYVNMAVVIWDSLKEYREVADGYHYIAQSTTRMNKWNESLRYAKIADSIYAKQGFNIDRNRIKLLIATDYKELGNYRLAIDLLHQCIDSFPESDYMQVFNYSELGIAQSLDGSFAEARKSFAKSLQLNREIRLPSLDATNYDELSRNFLRMKQVDSALYYAKLCENMCHSTPTDLDVYMGFIQEFRDVQEAKGDWAAALKYDDLYIKLQDSMYHGMLNNNIADAEVRFDITEKNQALSSLSAENELQKIKAQKQTLLSIFLLVALGLGFVIVVLVVSAYRRMLKKNALLAEQKAELQQQKDIIDAQVIQLASASKMKSKFLANISHELRTPVTLLNGMLEMISDGKTRVHSKEKERLDIAYNNSRKLQQMVEEILDLTKLENNKSEPVYEVKEVAPLIRRIVYAFETLIEKEGLVLEYDDVRAKGLYLSIDAGKFEKVMNNLMYNAIKFNKKGGHIKVSLYPGDDDRLCIDVADSGIGIADADLPHIFEHFYQGETQGLKAAGAGIGLSLVNEFTSLMGGVVRVKSKHGEGSTFTLQYNLVSPLAKLMPQPEDIADIPVKEWNPFAVRQRVLIVEDNTEMRYYLQEVLGEYVDIISAGNGHEGIACLERSVPDLIISDVMMPGMDGREFVKYLKAADRFKSIPVITLTALADMETQLSFLRLGVDDYIVKPFNAEELRIRVYNLLQNHAERKAFGQEPAEAGDIAPDSKEAEEFRQKVNEYVLTRIKNINVSVYDLAYELALSERQLYRLCKSMTGYSPAQLIKEIRLQKAYELLFSGDISKVDDVCKRVGYEKASYFSRQFYERFGKRPTEFL